MTAPQRSQLEALLAEMRSLLIRLESLAAGLPARSPLRGQLEAIARGSPALRRRGPGKGAGRQRRM